MSNFFNIYKIIFIICSLFSLTILCQIQIKKNETPVFNRVSLPPPQKKLKISFLLPFGSHSRRNVMLPIAAALADRGHDVLLLSGLPPTGIHPLVKEMQHDVPMIRGKLANYFDRRNDDLLKATLEHFSKVLPNVVRKMYNDDPTIKEMLSKKNEIDLFIIDSFFTELVAPFLHGKSFIITDPTGLNPYFSARLGNVLNPAFVPSTITDVPFTFWDRWKNLFDHGSFPFKWKYNVVPGVQKEISSMFPSLPHILEIERNATLVLAQSHFTLTGNVPVLPSQVMIGGHICKDPEILPQDIYDFINSSGEEGVIYFSLGSIAKGSSLPKEYENILVEVFAKLPHRILWKYESEIANLPRNILTKKWIPQQDVLGDPKVRLFISHGGLLSLIESICHSTPLLLLPLVGDQLKNADYVKRKEIGRILVWEELNVEELFEAVQDVIGNSKYATNTLKLHKAFMDRPESPLQTAVWWCEYAERANRSYFSSYGADLSWTSYFLLDFIATFCVIILLVSFVLLTSVKLVAKFLRKKFNATKSLGKRNKVE